MLGAVMSRTVITCKQVELLPQSSTAFHVRLIVYLKLQLPLTRESLDVMTTDVVEQLSVAVAVPRAEVLMSPLQLTLTAAGQLMVGAVISRTVICCKHVELLPH